MKYLASAFAILGFTFLYNVMPPSAFFFLGKALYIGIASLSLTLAFSKER